MRSAQPTHLLAGHHAIAIGTALPLAGVAEGHPVLADNNPRCTFSRRGQETWLESAGDAGIVLNRQVAPDRTMLKPGDEVIIDGTTFTLISVS